MQVYKKNGDYTATFLRYMRNAYERYLESEIDSIYKAYEKPSEIKKHEWEEIYNLSLHDAVIISHNRLFFTAAYIRDCADFGEWFYLETPFTTYSIQLKFIQ